MKTKRYIKGRTGRERRDLPEIPGVNLCITPRGAKTSSLTGVQSHFQKYLKKKGPEIDELKWTEMYPTKPTHYTGIL